MTKSLPNSTAYMPEKSNRSADDNVTSPTVGTTRSAASFSDTVSIERLTEEEVESTAIDTVLDWPLPSKPVFTMRGKTVTMWSIERRRIAKSFQRQWNEAKKNIASSGFAVSVGRLVNEIEGQMPNFRDIPGEDAFSGLLQLLCNVLNGENFRILQEKKLSETLDEIFGLLASEEKINLSFYQTIIEKLIVHGFIFQAI
jgi:hypothetical protein